MKKICFLIITILLLPVLVYAEDNNLVLKSITLEKLSEDVEELSPARIENNKINLDLKMYEVGDTAEYIVVVENPTDKDLYIEKNLVNTESTYFDYELLGVDKSTVIEKNSEKEFILKVKYQNEVEKENFYSAKYNDKFSLAFRFTSGINPETKRNLLLILVLFICLFIAFKYNKKNKVLFLLLLLGLIPFTTTAENNYNVGINSKILVKKVKPNPCTFNGELTQGAEYTNGQYTYRYMQQMGEYYDYDWMDFRYTWFNIQEDGWGVILRDKNSEEDVTTKLCTSINDKPIVSTSFAFNASKAKNIDLSSFDTSNVINMTGMFYLASALEQIDLSSFDTSKVTSMALMFYNSTLPNIDLHYFDTSNVTSMHSMFGNCSNVKELDLSSFNTSNVTTMSYMFYNASLLRTIKVSNKFQTSQVTNSDSMFTGSTSLVGGNGTVYDANHVDKEYARIDMPNTPGYFTSTD